MPPQSLERPTLAVASSNSLLPHNGPENALDVNSYSARPDALSARRRPARCRHARRITDGMSRPMLPSADPRGCRGLRSVEVANGRALATRPLRPRSVPHRARATARDVATAAPAAARSTFPRSPGYPPHEVVFGSDCVAKEVDHRAILGPVVWHVPNAPALHRLRVACGAYLPHVGGAAGRTVA
jgi:hypothetical protein